MSRLACLSALLASGCAAFTTSGGGAYSPQAPPTCSTSKLPVYADGAIAAAGVGTSLFLGLAALGNSGRRDELGYATLFTFLGSVVFAGSGAIGSFKVRSCSKAHEQWRMLQLPPPAPYPGQYPYPPPPTY